jgi:NADH dehydrogenase/NADH:ubiquinone oxidoreductase subunit G
MFNHKKMLVYEGSRRQVGGNVFKTAGRFIMPLLRRIGNALRPVAARAASRAGREALRVGKDVAFDMLERKNPIESIKKHAKKRAYEILKEESETDEEDIGQTGSGANIKRKRRSTVRKRKPVKRSRRKAVRGRKKAVKKAVRGRKKATKRKINTVDLFGRGYK